MPIDSELEQLSPEQRALYQLLMRQEGGGPAQDGIPRRDADADIPLTPAQKGLWLAGKTASDSPFRHPVVYRIRGPLRAAALEQALNRLAERHEILRTVCAAAGSEPVQLVESFSPRSLTVTDLQASPPQEREQEALDRASADTSKPFDLEKGPLWRASLYRLGEDDHVFVLVTHTFVSDGFSLGVLLSELGELYRSASSGAPSTLEDPTLQFGDYAAWQAKAMARGAYDDQLAYWRRRLAGCPARLSWPVDEFVPAGRSQRGATAAFRIDSDLATSIRELARLAGTTPYAVLLAALEVLLSGLTGQRDLLVGTMVSHRGRPELESMVGYSANNLLLRGEVSPGNTFLEFLRQVSDTVVDGFANQEYPFEQLYDELSQERGAGQAPTFQVMFVVHDQSADGSLDLGDLAVQPLGVAKDSALCDLYLRLTDKRSFFSGSLEYSTGLFDAPIIELVLAEFQNLLRSVSSQPEIALAELESLDREARDRGVAEWRSRVAARPRAAVPPTTDSSACPAPESEMERTVAAVWQEVLGLETVGVNDNFFDLGCRSLQLVQAHRALSEALGRELSVVDLFEFPTVRALARSLAPKAEDGAELDSSVARGSARRAMRNRRRR